MTPVVRPKTPRGDGNRMDPGELQMVREVVRPKTPRGDGNWIALTGLALILVVVRPKTPRGDGNSTSISLTSPGEKITSSDPKPRERTETRRRSRRCRCPNRRVVRPKTPRGDGNEPPRHVRRLQFLERMGSCQVVHRGGTRRSCVSGPVNQAARLCELAKSHPARLLASSDTLHAASETERAHWSLGETVTLRGHEQPTRLAVPT